MKKYPLIGFRPTKEMHDLIESVMKDTGMSKSDVMRSIIADYILFLRKSRKGR